MKPLKIFKGSCDASGVVHLDAEYFACGTDEANRVSIHPLSGNGEPSSHLDLDKFLGATWKEKKKKFAECDFESATRLGDLALWITSHARDKKGDLEPDRHRLFALKITGSGQELRLQPHGAPYLNLLKDLLSAVFPKDWPLADAATKAPQQEGGLNIEAICATPGGGVWIGFRNPVPQGLAILVELLNPRELIETTEAKSNFGRFVALDLGGRGVRDMVACDGGYLILAGAFDDAPKFALFEWDGGDKSPVLLQLNPAEDGLNPEGLLIFPNHPDTIHIFSDDDSIVFDGVANKDLPQEVRTFRAMTTEWPQSHS